MIRPNQRKSRNIIVCLRKGIVEDVYKPKQFAHVIVEIRDYDVLDANRPGTKIDDQGEIYSAEVW